MARALADPAVRDDRPVRRDPRAPVNGAELVRRLEGAILVADLPPRDVGRARDVPAALAGLRQPRRRQDLAGELLRAARSEEHTSELQSRENLVCRLLLEKKKRH